MTEQQPYGLIHRYPHVELRRYPAHVVAEVHVNATFNRAGNAAFRHLFNYISGSNTARQKLAMTAPVLQSGPLPGSNAPADFSEPSIAVQIDHVVARLAKGSTAVKHRTEGGLRQ